MSRKLTDERAKRRVQRGEPMTNRSDKRTESRCQFCNMPILGDNQVCPNANNKWCVAAEPSPQEIAGPSEKSGFIYNAVKCATEFWLNGVLVGECSDATPSEEKRNWGKLLGELLFEIAGRRDSAKCNSCNHSKHCTWCPEYGCSCFDPEHNNPSLSNARPATPEALRGMEAPAISPVAPAGPPCEAEIPRQSAPEASAPPEPPLNVHNLARYIEYLASELVIFAETRKQSTWWAEKLMAIFDKHAADLRAELESVKEALAAQQNCDMCRAPVKGSVHIETPMGSHRCFKCMRAMENPPQISGPAQTAALAQAEQALKEKK